MRASIHIHQKMERANRKIKESEQEGEREPHIHAHGTHAHIASLHLVEFFGMSSAQRHSSIRFIFVYFKFISVRVCVCLWILCLFDRYTIHHSVRSNAYRDIRIQMRVCTSTRGGYPI